MPDAASIGVLRDVALLLIIALGAGFGGYALMRHRRSSDHWMPQGNVISRVFDVPDALVSALLLFMLLSSLLFADGDAKAPLPAATASLSQQISAVLGQIIMMLFGGFIVLGWLRFVRGFDPVALFGLRSLSVRQVLTTAILWIVPAFVLVAMAGQLIEHLLDGIWAVNSPQEIVKSFQSSSSVITKALMAFAAVVVAPLTEELTFRGLFYGVFKRFTDTWFAAIVSSLLFATVHLHVASFVPLFVLAMTFVAAYELTGCLFVPMLMHAIFNAVMLISMVFS